MVQFLHLLPPGTEELKDVVNHAGHYMSFIDATREKGPSQSKEGSSQYQDDCLCDNTGKRQLPSQDKGHSEGLYMPLSIQEAHKERQSEGHYMTLSERRGPRSFFGKRKDKTTKTWSSSKLDCVF